MTLQQSLRDEFVHGMSRAAASVSVVTTAGQGGREGVTVSAMTPVSADGYRPTLLVCIHHLSPACSSVIENRVFCVNVLRDNQFHIADTFAGRIKPADSDKFSCTRWAQNPSGSPRVQESLVAFDCELSQHFRFGTHHIIIGEVANVFVDEGHLPLIYSNRTYGTPSTLVNQLGRTREDSSNDLLRIGCFFTFAPGLLPRLISRLIERDPNAQVSLIEGHQGQVVESLRSDNCDVAITYDMQLDSSFVVQHLDTAKPYVLISAEHPLANEPILSLSQLVDHPFILLETPPSNKYFLDLFRIENLKPNLRISSTSFETVRGLVGQGLGYSLLATKPASDRTYDGSYVVSVPLKDKVNPSPLVLVRRTEKPPGKLVSFFTEICREEFA